MTETWTSIGNAAELLHCDRELIYRWIAAGDLLTREAGTQVCLTVDTAASVSDMSAVATASGGRESALGLALAKAAQDDARRAERAASRNRILAASLGFLLLASAAVGSYEVARARVACEVTGSALIDAQRQNSRLIEERDEVRKQVAQATADAAELRGRISEMEMLREADLKQPRRTGTVIDTIVAMLQ